MVNIDILTHFDETSHASGITIFKLKEAERAAFFAKLPQPFRLLYLTEDNLNWRINEFGTARSEEIAEKIPDNPVLMSGEFSEILCYYIIPERYLANANLRPPKWKWKESKNNPAHFTDVILFHQNDPATPNVNDSLISIESKSRATRPGREESALQKAIDDAEKDYVGRLAESFFHLKTRYKDDKDANSVRQLERFMDLAKFPTYLKHFKAIAIVDESFADTHINNVTRIPNHIQDSFEVVLIRMENLKTGYEDTYAQMLTT